MAHEQSRGCSLLELIGLDEYAERVYRTVLSHQGLSPDALAPLSGLDAAAVRKALTVLEEKRLVRQVGDGYVAAPPDLGIEALLLAELAELLDRRQQIAELHDRLAELVVEHRLGTARSADFEGAEVVGDDAARLRVATEVREAVGEVACVCQTHLASSAAKDEPNGTAYGTDVSFRAIYAPEWLVAPGAMDHARGYVSLGRQIRTLPHPPIAMTVVDRRLALVPRDVVDPGQGGMLVLTAAPVVGALQGLFDVLWARALPLAFEVPTADDNGQKLPPELAALVPLLAAGMQDQAIARQLGIGLRTVRRRMQSLMELTGARTRLQAGIALARRGWV